jgi:hypothetical protein
MIKQKDVQNVLFNRYIAPAISAFPPSMAVKQWRRIRTHIRNLMPLGVSKSVAIRLGMSSKGYYRLVKTKAVQIALNNKWLKSQGVVSIEEQWVM